MSTAIGFSVGVAEVEALPEVDAEIGHRLELVDALDALGDDLAAVLVGAVDQRGHEPAARGRVLDAGGQRVVDLDDVGAQLLEELQRLGAAGHVVERDEGAALAVGGDELDEHVAVRAALGLDELEADPRRVGAEAADGGPGRAQRALDVEHGARVEVDEQHLAVGQQRQADLERGGAGPVVEGEQRVVGLGGGEQLAPAQLDRAELARASGPRGRTPRPWRGSTIGWKWGFICPCERKSGNQSVRLRSSSVSAGQRQRLVVGRGASRTGRRARTGSSALSRSLRRSGPAGTGQHEALDGDVAVAPARWPCARPCRARTDGATAVARRRRRSVDRAWSWDQHRPGVLGSLSAAGSECCAGIATARTPRPRGRPRPARRSCARPRRAPTRRRARPRSARARACARPPERPCSPASSGVRWPRSPVRSGRGSVASISSSERSRRELGAAPRWARSRR